MITLLKRLAGAVPMPASDKATFFVDADTGRPAVKDESGAVTDLGVPSIVPLTGFTLSTLPPAGDHEGGLIRVTDHTAGTGVCVSDGTDWVDVTTGATVA